jgi:hypothetical protein
MDAEDGGLLNIELSDDEVDHDAKASRRTGQSEEQFQAVKQSYHPKVENGNVSFLFTRPKSPCSSYLEPRSTRPSPCPWHPAPTSSIFKSSSTPSTSSTSFAATKKRSTSSPASSPVAMEASSTPTPGTC